MSYTDLHVHSTFSLNDGAGTPAAIAQRAVDLGWKSAAITEHGHLMSAPIFYKACIEKGIKPIIGCELYVTPDWALGEKGKEFQPLSYHLTVLALSKEGYHNLVHWVTESMQRENFYGKPRISIERMLEIAPYPLHHNVVLSGCLGSELCVALNQSNGSVGIGEVYVASALEAFPNFYIEVQNHAIRKFMGKGFEQYEQMIAREQSVRAKLIALSEQTGVPLVLTNDSHFQTPAQRKAHIAMKATAWRKRDDEHFFKSREQQVSGYLKDYIYFGSYMRNMEKVAGDEIPQSALHSIRDITREANIVLDPLDRFSYAIPFSGRDDPVEAIRRRAGKRLRRMLVKHGDVARVRFEHELAALGDFAHYLLLMSDFIRDAHRQGILTWTRGSAANSFLAYCLGIHEIDSIEYGLVFSRFVNPARKKLPDIDLDIQPDRYDDFMKIVHARMEPLVGEGQVEQICNYGTAANRSAFRTAASALGVPKETQDEIAKLLPQMIDEGVVDEDTDVFIALKEEYPEIYELTSEIFDSIRSVSQHACAWVFGTPERPLKDWVPMYLIASSGTLVTQYDFKTTENFGLTKMDFLRLKTLTVAAKTLRMVGRSPLDFYKLPLDDPETYEMIRAGKVEGVHTLQGKEVRKGAVKMPVENVRDVILAAALFRPSNTRDTDGAKTYLARRHGDEEPYYPHEVVRENTEDTLGIPVFQEQAMEICYAVGMSDAEVDDVYQAIKLAKGAGRGAKQAFAKIEPKFLKRAAAAGLTEIESIESWEVVKSYQGYGFNKGHATSYGILGDKMAYLKCHYPPEFHTNLLDTYPAKHKYIASAKGEGFGFLPPSVSHSEVGFSLDKPSGSIRVGVGRIKGLGPVATSEIIDNQPFTTHDDFLERTTGRGARQKNRIATLASIGALEDLGIAGAHDDAIEFHTLGFVLGKPRAFKGIKPRVKPRTSQSGWRSLGFTRGIEPSEGRTSVSKLFWIPPEVKLELKASPWAQIKTWLMTVVDENGIPFHLMVNEDQQFRVKLLKFFQAKCQDSVICADGMIRLPFLVDGPQGFRFFGITGAGYDTGPQVWGMSKKHVKAIDALAQVERRSRG